MNDFDPISMKLDVATPVAQLDRPVLPAPEKAVADAVEAPEIEEDFQEARANMKELISQAMEQIPDMINLMQQSQNDKMISAVSSFIKTTSDLNISLSKLSKEIKRQPKVGKEIKDDSSPAQVTHNHNSVFVGTTEDFLRLMANKQKEIKDAEVIEAEYQEVKT